MKQTLPFLILSLTLHAGIGWHLAQSRPLTVGGDYPNQVVDITIQNQDSTNLPPPIKTATDESPAETERPQISPRPSRTSREDLTTQPTKVAPRPKGDRPDKSAKQVLTLERLQADAFSPTQILRQQQEATSDEPFLNQLPPLSYRRPDIVTPPNMNLGSVAFLDDDPLPYYSFLTRFQDRIVMPWIRNLYAAAERARGRRLPYKTRWTTVLSFDLQEDGSVANMQLIESSGYPLFDVAARKALQNGAPYPNPPRELVQSSRDEPLHFAFTVFWEPPAR